MYKSPKDMGDEELLSWANAQLGTLDGLLAWVGWMIPPSKAEETERDYYARLSVQRVAREEARRRGLIP